MTVCSFQGPWIWSFKFPFHFLRWWVSKVVSVARNFDLNILLLDEMNNMEQHMYSVSILFGNLP